MAKPPEDGQTLKDLVKDLGTPWLKECKAVDTGWTKMVKPIVLQLPDQGTCAAPQLWSRMVMMMMKKEVTGEEQGCCSDDYHHHECVP